MTQQPVVVQRGPSVQINRKRVFIAIAVVIFIIAAVIHLGDAAFKYEATMEWAGFAFFAAAFL